MQRRLGSVSARVVDFVATRVGRVVVAYRHREGSPHLPSALGPPSSEPDGRAAWTQRRPSRPAGARAASAAVRARADRREGPRPLTRDVSGRRSGEPLHRQTSTQEVAGDQLIKFHTSSRAPGRVVHHAPVGRPDPGVALRPPAARAARGPARPAASPCRADRAGVEGALRALGAALDGVPPRIRMGHTPG